MANPEHLAILKQGVEVWNRWREENPGIQPDLSGEQFSGLQLARIDLRGADLRGADLTATTLREARLGMPDISTVERPWAGPVSATLVPLTNLKGASLRKAKLQAASLWRAILVNADLEEASLVDTDLREANLKGANLTRAKFCRTTITRADLRQVRGLETIVHSGRSSLDIDSIYMSKGDISRVFLQGIGLPDNFVREVSVLASKGFNSCFISFSSADEEFAKRLHTDLQDNGVRCWFAPEDMKIGDDVASKIDQSIRVYDRLLLVLSKASVESAWVAKEVWTALDKERQGKREVLFPIRLDDAVMETTEQWAYDIKRKRHIGDFTDWKSHDSYKKAFERLLRDLKAEG